jgi:methylthioribose-1-phosphate isomerase
MIKESALFWPVKLKGDIIYILDETKLPNKVTYIEVKDYKSSCRAIKEMKTRAVGQVLLVLYTFLLVFKQNKNKKNLVSILEKVATSINKTRPTLSFKFLTDMVLGWARQPDIFEKNILGFLQMLKHKRIEQAREASRLIKDKDVILTYCNVSGLMPMIGEFCRLQKKQIGFYVAETRPYLQGSRLTAWELKKQGFDVTVITDNMVAKVLSEGRINKVIVGADHLAQNGDIANKIGTYQLAILAKHFKIPFYVLCAPKTTTKTGKDIKIEIRPEKELLEYQGIRFAAKGVRGYYPAFDVTPCKLITKHIPLTLMSANQKH